MINADAVKLFPLKNLFMLLATGFGSGLFKKAPGTMGTIASLPLLIIIYSFINVDVQIALTLLMSFAGVYICGYAATKAKVHDHPAIVWDEFCGMFVAMIAIPISWHSILLGFVLFRFFDIVKPWPISIADKSFPGGFGIMFDDILAGLFSWAILAAIYIF